MRIAPRWYWGIIALIIYMVIVVVLWAVNDVDYATVQDSTDLMIKGIIIPIGLGSLFLILLTSWWGWWSPAMREQPIVAPRWTLTVPVLLLLAVLLNIFTVDFGAKPASYYLVLAAGVALIGFAEELVTRGLIIVGLRADLSKVWVWLISSFLFGLLHSINALFGQGASDTVTQIIFAFVLGTALYVVRMATGLLFVAMILHALWDFGVLGANGTGGEPSSIGGVLAMLGIILAFVSLFWIIRAKDSSDVAEVAATPAP